MGLIRPCMRAIHKGLIMIIPVKFDPVVSLFSLFQEDFHIIQMTSLSTKAYTGEEQNKGKLNLIHTYKEPLKEAGRIHCSCLGFREPVFFCNASHIFVVCQFFCSAPIFCSVPMRYIKNVITF